MALDCNRSRRSRVRIFAHCRIYSSVVWSSIRLIMFISAYTWCTPEEMSRSEYSQSSIWKLRVSAHLIDYLLISSICSNSTLQRRRSTYNYRMYGDMRIADHSLDFIRAVRLQKWVVSVFPSARSAMMANVRLTGKFPQYHLGTVSRRTHPERSRFGRMPH